MKNISIVLLNKNCEPGWLLHATTSEFHLDGSIVHNSKTLLVSAAFQDVQMKILRHQKTLHPNSGPCLAELHLGLALDGAINSSGLLAIEVYLQFFILHQ